MEITVQPAAKRLAFEVVEIREPLMEDVVIAERISGKTDGVDFQLALLSQIGTFDGEAKVYEDLRQLPMKDFMTITAHVFNEEIRAVMKKLSESVEK
jgi:hypothetical protein